MERTFYTKETVDAEELQLPDDVLAHIRSFIPCREIMRYLQAKKMLRFVAGRSNKWILSHIHVFEAIHHRHFDELNKYYHDKLEQGDTPKECQAALDEICWLQYYRSTYKTEGEYICFTKGSGTTKIHLSAAPRELREEAVGYYGSVMIKLKDSF